MNFWNNPENNSLKVLIIALVVAAAGVFVYKAMNNGGNTGRVFNTNNVSNGTAPVANTVEGQSFSAKNGDIIFLQENNEGDCSITVMNASNLEQKIVVNGLLEMNGSCVPNAKQENPASQGMADIMNGSILVQ